MYLNTHIFSTTGYARVLLFMFIHVYKGRARRNGYKMFISVYILCGWSLSNDDLSLSKILFLIS